MNDWKAATTKETFQHICGLQLFWRLAGKQCLTAASDHVPWGQMFPLSRVNAVRITGHKGKHGAVRVCPRGFPHEPLNEPHTVSPLAPYISLPCWGWVALPIPPLMFRKTRSTICDRRWNRPERAGPQLTVIYKIVLILPTVFFFFFFFFYGSLSSPAPSPMWLKLHKLRHKDVKRLSSQLCRGWTSRDRMATEGPLPRPGSMSLCCRGGKEWPRCARLKSSKDNFHYQTCVQ